MTKVYQVDYVIETLIAEIIKQVDYIRFALVELSEPILQEIQLNDMFYRIFQSVHCINGISDFIGFDVIEKICSFLEKLILNCRKDIINFGKLQYEENDVINLIKNAIHYFEKTCRTPAIQNDLDFKSEINLFCKSIQDTINN